MQVEEKVEAEKDINLTKKSLDLCARCGRQLIVIKVTKELVGNSMVTTTQMSCTDSVCQKGLELQLAKEKEARARLQQKPFSYYSERFKGKNQSTLKTQYTKAK